MNILLSAQLGGWLLVAMGALQGIPWLAALWFGEAPGPYLVVAGISLVVGLPLALGVRPDHVRLRPRDGFLIVVGAWLLASLFGTLPYLITGTLGPVDAFFESVAGFTTTGATVMVDLESQPKGILLWRSLTQWLGGMGIVVFTVALMPILGIGGMQLFKAEMPGPVTEKFRPRVAETARRIWMIYVGLTIVEFIVLFVAGLSGFDALCHSLTNVSTGGFSTQSNSVGGFHSPAVEWIVIVFMILAGTNFLLHYRALSGQAVSVLRDRELHYFLGFLLLGILVISLGTWSHSGTGEDRPALREIIFTVVSLTTGTGYAVVDYEPWSGFTHLVFLVLMVLGGMAGSTSGGVKSLRVVLALDAVRKNFATAGHRSAVRPAVRHLGQPVADDVISSVWAFLAVYIALAGLMALIISAMGYDSMTAVSAGLSAVGNVGPGLGEIGPFDHYSQFPALAKFCLSFCMIAGRLELFTLLVLFTPYFWRR